MGPEAVPELVAELDATDNNAMLRCMGFSLRAIGDKRAVPALVRAIPRTLIRPGSDMGLQAEDPDLLKFAQANDLNSGQEGTRYGFGRPVREVFGALQKLTDQKFNEEELYHIFLEGTESQQRMKRELFNRTAKKWADWWEQHATEFTQDPAYLHAGLPEAAPTATARASDGAHYKTAGGNSNCLLESVFAPNTRQCFYDLDTGRSGTLPEKWREIKNLEPHLDEIVAWAAREGFDLMGTEFVDVNGERRYALRAIGLRAWELGANRWKMTTPDVITTEALQREGTPTDGLLLHYDKHTDSIDAKAHAPFFYITREGTPGLLYAGIEVKDDSLKPGGISRGDDELNPVAFRKGRRFAFKEFVEAK